MEPNDRAQAFGRAVQGQLLQFSVTSQLRAEEKENRFFQSGIFGSGNQGIYHAKGGWRTNELSSSSRPPALGFEETHQTDHASRQRHKPANRVGQNQEAPPHRMPAVPANAADGAQPEQGANPRGYQNEHPNPVKECLAFFL